MSKKILIAYANQAMYSSLQLFKVQAHYLKVFDKILLYTDKDLPPFVLKSPLMKYERGGGYWIWKPYIIWHTLQQCNNVNDIVCYLDCGNIIHPGKEWNEYFSYMEKYDTVCFQYQKEIPKWKKFGSTSSEIKYWSKKKTLDFFSGYLGSDDFKNFCKIWGGFIICKNRDNPFIKEWLDLSISYPDLIIDPMDDEINDQYPFFTGRHRHDQAIITPLAYKHQREGKLCVLPERFDVNRNSEIVSAVRDRTQRGKGYYRKYIAYHLQGIIGERYYRIIKKFAKKHNL